MQPLEGPVTGSAVHLSGQELPVEMRLTGGFHRVQCGLPRTGPATSLIAERQLLVLITVRIAHLQLLSRIGREEGFCQVKVEG